MEDFLVHHGIVGMKWGVRRYQNPDGSLTPAGRNRYNKDTKKLYRASANYQRASEKRERKLSRYIRKSEKGPGFTTDKDIEKARSKYVSANRKVEKALSKYNKQYSKMEKRYWNKSIKDIPQEDIIRGKEIATRIAQDSGNTRLRDLQMSTIEYGKQLLKKK